MMPGQQRLSPPQQRNYQGKKASKRGRNSSLGAPGMGGWLNKILSTSSSSNSSTVSNANDANDEASDNEGVDLESSASMSNEKDEKEFITEAMSKVADKKLKKRDRQARAAAVAAATAIINQHQDEKENKKRKLSSSGTSTSLSSAQKIDKHLTRLQALCKPTPLKSPSDPVRSRSWDAWTIREHGAIIFRKNRRALNSILKKRNLRIDVKAGTMGMGSVLRQMLSIKDISHDMDDLITCAVEFEAARSQRMQVNALVVLLFLLLTYITMLILFFLAFLP
jgi:hypothetical protein